MNLPALIFSAIKQGVTTERELRQLKAQFAEKSRELPNNAVLLDCYRSLLAKRSIKPNVTLERLLTKRRGRSLSGVSVVAVLTRPFGCPGKCTFCPTERGMPKSYLSNQPAASRAVRNQFDPYTQVTERLATLIACGHPAEKIELIILGGTWTALPRQYQSWFVRRCLQALNEIVLPTVKGGRSISPLLRGDARGVLAKRGSSLKDLQLANEQASHRLVGFTVETRPDWLDESEVKRLRELGVTRVELGAQSIYDDILRRTKRGHLTDQTIAAVKLLKDAGMKVGLHLMPNLPGSSPKKDLAMFGTVFESGDYMPDQIKIYPCSVLAGTALEQEWRQKKYRPYSDAKLTELVAAIYPLVPEWCRISRVVRDIPTNSILAGAKITNLRQVLTNRGIKARDIHDREIRDEKINLREVKLIERCYSASGGTEIFLSYEDVENDKLVAFCRLRLTNDKEVEQGAGTRSGGSRDERIHIGRDNVREGRALASPPLRMIAFIRELHSYGQEVAIGKQKESGQHKGYGRRLLVHAEVLAKKAGYQEIWIPAGCGVRPYYRKFGYKLVGTYMCKKLNSV